MELSEHARNMKAIFDALFASESPKIEGNVGNDEPSFVAVVNFRSGYRAQGPVARMKCITPWGISETLKLAMPSQADNPAYPGNPRFAVKVMAEHYFDYEDVESVIILRPIDASKIITDAKPSGIIVG